MLLYRISKKATCDIIREEVGLFVKCRRGFVFEEHHKFYRVKKYAEIIKCMWQMSEDGINGEKIDPRKRRNKLS
jgi:hypothetical protein